MLRREWFNASNFTRAVTGSVAIFNLFAVSMGAFTGGGAIFITTCSIVMLLSLSVDVLIVRHRRRKALPPRDAT